MEIKVIDEPIESTVPVQNDLATDSDPSLSFLEDWFELSSMDRRNVEQSSKVKYIYNYLAEVTGVNDPMSYFRVLRDISYKLGAPRIGMNKLQQIYQYAKIQNQQKVVDMKMEELRA